MSADPLSTVPAANFAHKYPAAFSALFSTLAPQQRHVYIQPPAAIPTATLAFAKATLDVFAVQISDEQAQRQNDARKKRKRGKDSSEVGQGEVLKIRKLHTEGFAVEQVWEQAKRIIDALRIDAETALEQLPQHGDKQAPQDGGDVEMLRFGEDGFEVASEDESSGSGDAELEEELESGEEDDQQSGGAGEDEEGDIDFEDGEDEQEGADMDELLEDLEGSDDDEEESAGIFVEDPHGLNDGFFSIDEFNKQTEFLEQADAAADPYTGEASDEEDIDWTADPMTMATTAKPKSRRDAAMDIGEENAAESDDEDDGPTFGNADLNAPEGDSEVEDDGEEDGEMADDMELEDNTNDILYKDFFEPPPRKADKGERQTAYLERQERKNKTVVPADDGADVERAMADVRRDLFDDMSDHEDSEDALSDVDPADPKSRRSAHERKQAKLAEEIRRLEAASVQKRDWTLSGEARAADRPLNSLLEEDLDFERTGKPVPVITAEVSESIEDLIKRRILAQEFDEVIRRRPDALTVPANARRGAFELDDTKNKQSLAEMYEEEHIKATNPDTYVSKTDEKLKKEHDEIERLWKDVSAKLDSLSSWHYTPKPAAPSLTVVGDVATISMEDAQPTTASGIGGSESMLAPQEIYKAGKDKETIEKGEVVPKSGAPVARDEMSREQKLRRRRREKERIKKRGGEEIGNKPESKKAKEKRETVGDLKRAGVKVIGKKGEVRDVDGNKIKAAVERNGAGGFKL